MVSYSPRHGENWHMASNTDLTGVGQGTTVYFRIVGAGGNTSTESDIQFLAPERGLVTKLIVDVSQNNTNNPTTFTLRKNSTDASTSVSIPAGSTGTFTDTTESTIAAEDLLALELTVGAGDTGDTVTLQRWAIIVSLD